MARPAVAPIISIIGMPGSGKTTLAKELAKRTRLRHISAGDVARKLADVDEETKSALARGEVAPRDKMNDAMLAEIQPGTILDGYPRYMAQYKQLIRVAVPKGAPVYFIILVCRNQTARDRLAARNRDDDMESQINRRIRTHREETIPVVSRILDDGDGNFVFAQADNTPVDTLHDVLSTVEHWVWGLDER